MANFIQKLKARRRIPQEVYQLIESINARYFNLNLDNGDFRGLSEREKLSKLIDMINRDTEISKLNSLSHIGSIRTISQVRVKSSAGYGLNLCIGERGLFIYDWNDLKSKHNEILATPDSLEEHIEGINAEDLREDIVSYTDRKSYIKRVADFGKFR